MNEQFFVEDIDQFTDESSKISREVTKVLPTNAYEVAKVSSLELYIIKIPIKEHSFNKYWLQMNYRSGRYRLIISYREYQKDMLKKGFDSCKSSDEYKKAQRILNKGAEALLHQQAIKKEAEAKIAEIIKEIQ